MIENFCLDIMQSTKCFPLERFNLSCQAEHTKINSRLNFNPGLALIAFWTTGPCSIFQYSGAQLVYYVLHNVSVAIQY